MELHGYQLWTLREVEIYFQNSREMVIIPCFHLSNLSIMICHILVTIALLITFILLPFSIYKISNYFFFKEEPYDTYFICWCKGIAILFVIAACYMVLYNFYQFSITICSHFNL